MIEYRIVVEETCAKDFLVLADNAEEAYQIAREKYKKGIFALEPGDLISASIGVFGEGKDDAMWEDA